MVWICKAQRRLRSVSKAFFTSGWSANSLFINAAILVVAALSFLGLGIAPPATNWGAMLSDGLNFTYSGFWWLTYPPGVAIVLTVLAFNVVGDGLRDAFGLDSKHG